MKKPVRPIVDTLREIRDGDFLDELSDSMNALVGQVCATDKAGKLVVTLEVKPINNSAYSVMVVPEVAIKAPKLKPAGTIFYPTNDRNLSRRDPRQQSLPGLEAVERKADPIDVDEPQTGTE